MAIPCVSVIVPVYNTKEYLEQCLNSLLTQSLKEIEIIIIDDGSFDGSSIVCDEYAVKDSRISVVHKKNEGLAAARNDGVKLAKSDYIMYVDSDDWVEPEFCEKPFKVAIEKNADIVCFQYYRFSGEEEIKKLLFPIEGIVSKEDVLTQYWTYTYATSMNKLYRRSLFSGVYYPVGRYSEDIAVAYKLIYKAETIIFLNDYLYHYRTNRPGSICNSGSLKHKEDHMYFTFKMLEDLKMWGLASENEVTRYAMSYLLTLGRQSELSDKCDNILKNSSYRAFSWKFKVMMLLNRFIPGLFDLISLMKGVRFKGVEK